jgi:hypothetical protein
MNNTAATVTTAVITLAALSSVASANHMDFTGPELTEWVKIYCDDTRADRDTVRAGIYGVIYEGREYKAFCVDLDQYAGDGAVSPMDIDILANPTHVAYLFERFIASAVDSEHAAALGVSLWEVLYETDDVYNVCEGEFRIGRNGDVASLANAMLSEIPDQYEPTWNLTVLHSPCKQDMLIGTVGSVPEPATLGLLLAGSGLLVARRRKRA